VDRWRLDVNNANSDSANVWSAVELYVYELVSVE